MLRLVERPDPVAGHGEAVIEVAAVAVNRLDVWVRENQGHAYQAVLPVVPGYDVAGTVLEVGEGVDHRVRPGDRVYVHYDFSCGRCRYCLEGDEAACQEYEVMGVNRDGGYAERIVAPERNVFFLPRSVSFQTAAAAGSVYLTAYHMLFARAGLRPGETVLVSAAGSGVGGAAIALARFAGARVFATASTEDKRRRALEAGVERAFDPADPDWSDEAFAWGVHVAVDHVGQAVVPELLRTLSPKGRLVLCGASSGPRVELDLIDLFARQISIIGSSDGSRAELQEVFRQLGYGRLDPPAIHTVLPLEQAAEAQAILERRDHYGRVLLDPRMDAS